MCHTKYIPWSLQINKTMEVAMGWPRLIWTTVGYLKGYSKGEHKNENWQENPESAEQILLMLLGFGNWRTRSMAASLVFIPNALQKRPCKVRFCRTSSSWCFYLFHHISIYRSHILDNVCNVQCDDIVLIQALQAECVNVGMQGVAWQRNPPCAIDELLYEKKNRHNYFAFLSIAFHDFFIKIE